MIDLSQFCAIDRWRINIREPFSRGERSYATDGRLLIRVPRRADVPENAESPNVERVWPKYEPAFRAPKTLTLPPQEQVECDACDGRGTKHDCPSCDCECEECDGEGRLSTDRRTGVRVGQCLIALRYARVIFALPGIEICEPPLLENMLFRFDGGDGVLVCMRRSDDAAEIEV